MTAREDADDVRQRMLVDELRALAADAARLDSLITPLAMRFWQFEKWRDELAPLVAGERARVEAWRKAAKSTRVSRERVQAVAATRTGAKTPQGRK